ncbi:amidohydrolase [Microbispora sp. NPDC049125]|uniref:amidohydrolase n=1 Tax=Microbispora sp. NPDC049125 TaxID=3154929 RepID=UPI00346736F6
MDLEPLIRFRRDIHSHPELARQEIRTTAAVADMLTSAGLEPRIFPSGTGLVCDIQGTDGPTVGLRADMDALPILDAKDVPYRSQNVGVCHACGHDVHTTILVGAALELAKRRHSLPGRVRLVFQPAEESSFSGSLDMIAGGAIDGVDVMYALHCDPSRRLGEVGVRTGAITSAQDHIVVRLRGKGGHSARPHLATNPINVLASVIARLPEIVNQALEPDQGVLIGFGMMQAGEAPNAIPASAHAGGTVRIPNAERWEEIPSIVQKALGELIEPFGIEWELDYNRVCPAVVNDAVAAKILYHSALTVCGEENVREAPQSLGGEDFAWYLRQVPGALFRLGVTPPDATVQMDLHSAAFDVDERAIEVGVKMFVEVAHNALQAY